MVWSHTIADAPIISFDVDYPIDCDDEYWVNDDPELAFKQPPGKPSKITFFNLLLRLKGLHAFAMRTIVSNGDSAAQSRHLTHSSVRYE